MKFISLIVLIIIFVLSFFAYSYYDHKKEQHYNEAGLLKSYYEDYDQRKVWPTRNSKNNQINQDNLRSVQSFLRMKGQYINQKHTNIKISEIIQPLESCIKNSPLIESSYCLLLLNKEIKFASENSNFKGKKLNYYNYLKNNSPLILEKVNNNPYDILSFLPELITGDFVNYIKNYINTMLNSDR